MENAINRQAAMTFYPRAAEAAMDDEPKEDHLSFFIGVLVVAPLAVALWSLIAWSVWRFVS